MNCIFCNKKLKSFDDCPSTFISGQRVVMCKSQKCNKLLSEKIRKDGINCFIHSSLSMGIQEKKKEESLNTFCQQLSFLA